jgi:hypothetical protein
VRGIIVVVTPDKFDPREVMVVLELMKIFLQFH